jgi:hypothetical protein
VNSGAASRFYNGADRGKRRQKMGAALRFHSDLNRMLDFSIGRKEAAMDGATIIRVVSAVLFVIVLVVLIQRRRTRVK